MTTLTQQTAIEFITVRLKERGLFERLKCQIITLLTENRRATTLTNQAGKTSKRGNQHVFGSIPFQYGSNGGRGLKACYQQDKLSNWIDTVLIPKLEGAK